MVLIELPNYKKFLFWSGYSNSFVVFVCTAKELIIYDNTTRIMVWEYKT